MGIIQSDLTQEMEQSFLDYSLSVITDRSLPRAQDGLKPVHSRILWSMFESGTTSSKAHKKSARIVGDTMGKYHPHGDSSIYEALARMSQSWSMRYPLVDFHGNNGSQDGDGPAAMRYTECRLSKVAEAILEDIKKDVVGFRPNFSNDEREPVVLPGIIPQLLVNGTSGIAVGMACSFAPHNMTEVMNAIISTIQDPEITTKGLMDHISGPDFPTGGILINKDELLEAYSTGRGRARVRGRYHIEQSKKGDSIVFTEIPMGVMKEDLISNIALACEGKKITGVSDVHDESDNKGMRLIIEVQKDGNADSVVAQLFKHTRLEDTYSINQNALIDKQPKLLGLKDMIECYIDHQKNVLTRKTTFELNKALNRLEIVDGLLIALEDIDNVISLIRASSSTSNARENLEKKYKFTEAQSKAIVDLKLGKLARLEKVEIEDEKKELKIEVGRCNNILNNESILNKTLVERIQGTLSKFSDTRRTDITQVNITKEEKEIELIKPEDVVVVITKAGNIKRISSKLFKVQKKNGKGVANQDDITMDVIRTNTIDTLMIFSNAGKVYRLSVDTVPSGTNSSRGVSIKTLVNMPEEEEALLITSLYHKTNAEFVVFATKNGIIKKTSLNEYTKLKKNGVIAINFKEGDSLSSMTFLKDEPILLITKKGMCIRFETEGLPMSSRIAMGVKGIGLNDEDEIVALLPINKETDELAIFTENGMGRKTPLKEFPVQGRAGKGTIGYKCNDSTGPVVAASLLDEDDNILIVGYSQSIAISSKDIPSLGKGTIGNIMIKGNKVISAIKI